MVLLKQYSRDFIVLESTRDCWICYDVNRKDAGPMIFPCQCKGDVAAAHQECLKRWLMEVTQFALQKIFSMKLLNAQVRVTGFFIESERRS